MLQIVALTSCEGALPSK